MSSRHGAAVRSSAARVQNRQSSRMSRNKPIAFSSTALARRVPSESSDVLPVCDVLEAKKTHNGANQAELVRETLAIGVTSHSPSATKSPSTRPRPPGARVTAAGSAKHGRRRVQIPGTENRRIPARQQVEQGDLKELLNRLRRGQRSEGTSGCLCILS